MQTNVVSRVNGRIRFRVARPHRQQQKMDRIAETLAAHPQVKQVQTNVATGSLLIHYDRENGGWENVLTVLQDLGIIVGNLTESEVALERSTIAANSIAAMDDLNRRMRRMTDGSIDLKLLFPLALSLLALRQLRLKGWQLDLVPWYVLAWYAFDSFIKLNHNKSK
jgi:hypothetical protein